MGFGAMRFDIDLDSGNADWLGNFQWAYTGPYIYTSIYF